MTEKMPIVILCDATECTGLGHFMRCVALTLGLQKQNCSVHFLGQFNDVACTIARYFQVALQQTSGTVAQRALVLPQQSYVVVDSYQYQPTQLTAMHHYVVLDDFCNFSAYPVQGVINFTLSALAYNYVAKGAKAQALGLPYYLPHPDITHQQQIQRSALPQRILVMIGSGDQHNMAQLVVLALQRLQLNLNIKVVTAKPKLILSGTAPENVELVVPVATVSDYYEWADFCITSGGLAKYECAYLGKPAAVISLTDAEAEETKRFSQAKLCFDLGHFRQQTAAGLASSLAELLRHDVLRSNAQQACRAAFTADSVEHAADFVIRCFSGDQYDKRQS